MTTGLRSLTTQWTILVPVLAIVLLVLTWGRTLPGVVVALVTIVLAGSVLAAVHHAEVVAHREPMAAQPVGDQPVAGSTALVTGTGRVSGNSAKQARLNSAIPVR